MTLGDLEAAGAAVPHVDAVTLCEVSKLGLVIRRFLGSAQESVRRPDWRGDYESQAPAAVCAFQRNATSGTTTSGCLHCGFPRLNAAFPTLRTVGFSP